MAVSIAHGQPSLFELLQNAVELNVLPISHAHYDHHIIRPLEPKNTYICNF